ncbi:hypothetical protein [Sphingomonas sp. MM-1]|uniref:hypothetical protein n=1 Tax=Sphingomonas sp. MM-1 TaxID=745310 RepID=UPI0016513B08|nr:hypothetical protein [Sphingomonas sp. MM-1]
MKSVIVPSVQSPPSMLKLHDFCNRAVQTDAGYVTVSRDWPSHRMETVDSLVDEIAAAPGITHIALPASEGQEP